MVFLAKVRHTLSHCYFFSTTIPAAPIPECRELVLYSQDRHQATHQRERMSQTMIEEQMRIGETIKGKNNGNSKFPHGEPWAEFPRFLRQHFISRNMKPNPDPNPDPNPNRECLPRNTRSGLRHLRCLASSSETFVRGHHWRELCVESAAEFCFVVPSPAFHKC